MVSITEFKILLLQKNKTMQDWAKYLNIAVSTLYRKLDSEESTDFSREEIIKTCEFFEEDEMFGYFFTKKVS